MATARVKLEGPIPGAPFLVMAPLDARAGYVRGEWLAPGAPREARVVSGMQDVLRRTVASHLDALATEREIVA